MISLSLWLSLANAEEPSPARQCAEAAEGTAIDVCTAIAARYPDAAEEVAIALAVRLDRGTSEDRALLQVLLALLSEERAIDAATRLGELHDPRAVPVLLHTARTRRLEVALAATRALGRWQESAPLLAELVADEDTQLPVRIEAGRVLGAIQQSAGAEALLDALRVPSLPRQLRRELRQTLITDYPSRAAERVEPVSEAGTMWLSAAGAVGLGTTMASVGQLGQSDLALVGAGAGALAGATGGFLIGRAWPTTEAEGAHLTLLGAESFVAGALIGGSYGSEDGPWVGTLIGGAVGYSAVLGAGPWIKTQSSVADAHEAALFGLSASVAASQFARFADRRPSQHPPALAGGLGLALGGAIGTALAPRVHVHPRDAYTIGLSSAVGVATIGLLPVRQERRHDGMVLAGLGAGAMVGLALSEFTEPDPDTVAVATAAALAGGVAGNGIARIAFGANDQATRLGTVIGLGGALGTGLLLADRNPDPLDPRDAVLATAAAGVVGWNAAAIGQLSGSVDDRAVGVALLLPAAAALGVTAASPALDVRVPLTTSATSLGLWGAYAGNAISDLQGKPTLQATLIGSDIGLGIGVIALSPILDAPPLAIAVGDIAGVTCGALAALGTSVATRERDALLTASLVGAGVGFIGGTAGGLAISRNGPSRHVAQLVPGRLGDALARVHVGGSWQLAPGMSGQTPTLGLRAHGL